MSAAGVLGMIAGVAVALQFAQAYPGPLEIPRTIGPYGTANFTTGDTAYPRRAIDAEGYRIKISRPVKTIGSQSWSIDEFVYSMVPPQSVVAVSEYAYERSYSNVYEWVEKFRPAITANPEIVLKLNPDLLLVSSTGRSDFTDLVKNGGSPVVRLVTGFTPLGQNGRAILVGGYPPGEGRAATADQEEFQPAIPGAKTRRAERR